MKKNKWILILFIISFSLFLVSFFSIDPDYLWHIKAGEYMFKNGLLTHDVFSWSVYSKYWMSHEWLFEIIIYSLKYVFGNYHLFIYCLLCILVLLFTIYHGNKKLLFNNYLFTIVWFALSFILIFSIQGRPHLISFCLLSLTTYFLYDLYKNEDSKKIYFLPLISIIWANVHGGSSNLPYLLCLLFVITGLFNFKYSKIEAKRLNKKQILKYLIISLICMICVCINIHGIRMFIYPYQNMIDSTMLSNITEWQVTSLNKITHYIYYGLLLIIICIFLFSKKRIEFIDFILLGFCAYLGLKSIRFWFYTYIIMSYVVFYYVGRRKIDNGTHLGIGVISILLILLFIKGSGNIINAKYSYLLKEKDINIVKSVKPERLFNMYDYGGDLVYNGIPVFIDGRADLYGKYNYNDYLDLSLLEGNYEKVITKYDFDYYLIDKKYPIYNYLRNHDEYELIYNNKKVLLYKKRTTE